MTPEILNSQKIRSDFNKNQILDLIIQADQQLNMFRKFELSGG